MTASLPLAIDPADPVFLSYRHSDGTRITGRLAWLLRAAGVPVWRDVDDLPPGDTIARLQQAIDDGISGAVIVVTPEIENSKIVREIEAPRLLDLHTAHPEFTLGIVNAAKRGSATPDYTEPDQLLRLTPGTLSGVDQQPASRAGLHQLVDGLLGARIAHLRSAIAAADHTLELSIQTRNTPQVYDRTGGQLDLRLRPAKDERLPSRVGLADLAEVIGLLPDAVVRSGATGVVIRGGGHLSVALALGAALPSTRVGRIRVIDHSGEAWASGSEPVFADPPNVQVASQGSCAGAGDRTAVAVFVDMLPTRSDAAFERFLDEHGIDLAAWLHLTSVSTALLDPDQAGRIAADLAAHLRQLSAAHSNAEIHLLLRCPFPLAVLVGRLTNTLQFVAYEWNNSQEPGSGDRRPQYLPCMRIEASSGAGVIQQVLLPSGRRSRR